MRLSWGAEDYAKIIQGYPIQVTQAYILFISVKRPETLVTYGCSIYRFMQET